MNVRRSIALGLAALLTSCATGTKLDPAEPATVAELDAAIQAASQALLSGTEVAIVGAYFDVTDTDRVVRYDWVDYRPDGDVLAVHNHLDRTYTEGFSRSGGSWLTAFSSNAETQPWQAESLGGPAEEISAIGELEAMTKQETLDQTETTVTRQIGSDGTVLWVLITPDDNGDESMTREWIIHRSGMVQVYRIFSEAGLGDDVGTIVFEYGVGVEDPEPVITPVAGTPLVLDELGIPDQLRDLEPE